MSNAVTHLHHCLTGSLGMLRAPFLDLQACAQLADPSYLDTEPQPSPAQLKYSAGLPPSMIDLSQLPQFRGSRAHTFAGSV